MEVKGIPSSISQRQNRHCLTVLQRIFDYSYGLPAKDSLGLVLVQGRHVIAARGVRFGLDLHHRSHGHGQFTFLYCKVERNAHS